VPNLEHIRPIPEPSGRWPQEPLRSTLIDSLRHCVDADAKDADVAAAVGRCAREARDAGLRSEQLVVALRNMWEHASTTSLRRRRAEHPVTLTRLVDLALTAYHRDD
jgi:hypothetical protein